MCVLKRELNSNLANVKAYCNYILNYIPYEKAMILIKEGRGFIINNESIAIPLNSKKFRKYILERDNHICYYCGKPGDTIDHIIPRSKGGYSTPKNCVCACYNCNREKGNKILAS